MEKLNLNQSLRIYIPGLFLSLMLYYIAYQKLEGMESTLLPAIFIGLLFPITMGRLQRMLFTKIETKPLFNGKNFDQNWLEIVMDKMNQYGIDSKRLVEIDHMEDQWLRKKAFDFMSKSFFVKKYYDAELNYFRFPKSMGIMFFYLFISCLIGLALSIAKTIYFFGDEVVLKGQLIIVGVLVLISILFFRGCRSNFMYSINRELDYWRVLDKAQVERLAEIISSWK
ncbi:MAG: hypothetical protein Aureis2KO_08700 [Aureisphaera sp.]